MLQKLLIANILNTLLFIFQKPDIKYVAFRASPTRNFWTLVFGWRLVASLFAVELALQIFRYIYSSFNNQDV